MHVDAENRRQTLEEELEFLKQVHEQVRNLALSYTRSPRVLTVGCHALTSSITARLIYLFIALVPSRTLNAQHHLIHYLTAAVNVYLTHTHTGPNLAMDTLSSSTGASTYIDLNVFLFMPIFYP